MVSKLSISVLNLWNRRVLSKIIVQHQSEARNSPSITALTTIWADQNISKMLVSGDAAAAATSAGFIGGGNLLLGGDTAGKRERGGVCAANRPKLGLLRDAGKA